MQQFTKVLNSYGGMRFQSWITPSVDIPNEDEKVSDFIARNAEGAILLLEGGSDINPALYGEKNNFSYISKGSRQRDTHERTAIDAALMHNVPILGICRGHQLLAAHFGGTLWQDIEYELKQHHAGWHAVETLDIYHTFRAEDRVNSLHHQAVRDIPRGAVETARYIKHDKTSYVNEALYYPGDIFSVPMFSVQWHPELMGDAELFDWALLTLFNLAPPTREGNDIFDYRDLLFE